MAHSSCLPRELEDPSLDPQCLLVRDPSTGETEAVGSPEFSG